MKRYDLILTPMGRTSIGEVAGGRFVLADDPAIQAAVEAMEYGTKIIETSTRLVWQNDSRENIDKAVRSNGCLNALRAAIAGLKGEAARQAIDQQKGGDTDGVP